MAGATPELQKNNKGAWDSYLEVREDEAKPCRWSRVRGDAGVGRNGSSELSL